MPSQAEFERSNTIIAEAVALYEQAELEFERVHDDIEKSLAQGRAPTTSMAREEDRARAALFLAEVRLSRRLNPPS